MARKKKPEEHENLERWLVSYADFITLLFATFVVLYALSQMDLAKFKDLKISLQKAFAPTILQGKEDTVLENQGKDIQYEHYTGDQVNIIPPINPQLEIKKMDQVQEEIEKAIKEGELEGVSVKKDTRGLVISLVDSVFFDSGSAHLKQQSLQGLNNVALEIKKSFPSNKIRVEGHTDSDPISTGVYPSNWELSAGRAASVVRHFIKSFKMPKESFSAVGYADSVPIASNKTAEGKNKNRRVEIVILNSETAKLDARGEIDSEDATAETPAKKPEEQKITIIKGGRVGGDINDISKELEQEEKAEIPPQQIFDPIEELKQAEIEAKEEHKPSLIIDVKKEKLD